MNRQSLLSLVLTLTICSSVIAQEPKSTPKPTRTSPTRQEPVVPADDDVVRITANLVQVDAVVTDKNGAQITDLTDQEFEVFEDGRPQKISNLSYVTSAAASTGSATEAAPKAKNKGDEQTPMPAVQLRPEQVHRTIALVVDDLGLSFESTAYVRQALKKFVDEQLQPGDLAAIIRTSAGTGAAQHFSTRDPERVFLEVINEPMVEDGYRWFGMQGKLISAIRSGAPQHTIIASGHRWSGLAELLFMLPYADRNIIYNFHFYEPFAFTHQGATWAGANVSFYKNIPYPSSPESVGKVLDTIQNEPARNNLVRYGEDRWNATRIDREISMAAAWAANYQVPLTCNEFGTYRNFAPPADRAVWIGDMRAALEKYGIGWTMWDYAGGFGVVHKQNGHPTADVEVVKALGLAVNK